MDNAGFSRDLINYIFENNDDRTIVSNLDNLIKKSGDCFHFETIEAIVNSLEAKKEQSDILTNWVDSLYQSDKIIAKVVYWRVKALTRKYNEVIEGISGLLDLLPTPDPLLLLYHARLLVREKRMAEAATDIQKALFLYPPYSFYVKCEKLVKKILQSGEWNPRRNLKVAILGSTTTTFFASVLQASCFRDGINALIYEGNYGNYQQEILNTTSGLYRFAPDVVVIMPNHRDLALPPQGKRERVEELAREIRNLWTVLQDHHPCHIVQVGFDIPPEGAWGGMEDFLPDGRSRLIQYLNFMLLKEMPKGVSFLDINRVALKMGEKFYSNTEWYTVKQYPSTEALPLFSNYITAYFRAILGLSAKVLVLDLDNTLWGGVVGEDGVEGIVIGPPSPAGEGYLELQRYIKDLKERGVLLSVCSKNNIEDAKLPFQEHDSMILNLDDFVVFTANWQDKATNIENMAETLSLGLDSFVFIDDNPLERCWVRTRLPQVIVPNCGNTPWEILNSLRQGKFFESIAITVEDINRHQSYKANVARHNLKRTCGSLKDFLCGLEMVAESGPIDRKTIIRVTQLINKTNQFNLTTRRYSEKQVKFMSESPEWWTRWFRLKDKFGDHGLIGVILARKNGTQWDVDSWLMSCRVLGRNMEEFMGAQLLNTAKEEGAEKVCGQYIPTGKNVLVRDMYTNLGFDKDDKNGNYFFDFKKKVIPVCKFINADRILNQKADYHVSSSKV